MIKQQACKQVKGCEGLWGLVFTVHLHGKSDIKQWASKRVKYCSLLLPFGIRHLAWSKTMGIAIVVVYYKSQTMVGQ